MKPTPSIRAIALEHAKADERCNRSWECACGACNIVRRESYDEYLAEACGTLSFGEWSRKHRLLESYLKAPLDNTEADRRINKLCRELGV